MRLEQLTKPASQPVSLDEAKRQCSLLESTHDILLLSLIDSATRFVENKTASRLVTQTLRIYAESFDGHFPVYPLQSIDAIAYDSPFHESEQALSTDKYWIKKHGAWPSIEPVTEWPTLVERKPESVRIDVTVGYGDDVPADIKAAILIRVKEMFDVRGESRPASVQSTSMITVMNLLAPYMRPKL